ncbi:hypothetical protein [Poseidonibacter antarcticus]|uniref:hypothetical protein n=1 Tax=Poseidonibacter antarcticus TaxID=2478538 RepID=UPI000EF499AD|nr:hypothetical protein [Poseidonibacter antarcticus]
MLNLLFKTTAYYVIWQKFKKQILLISFSVVLIGFIGMIYDDLFDVLKVTDKESIGILLFTKWFFISFIIAINIYALRKTKIKEKKELKPVNPKTQEILKKEKVLTRTDLILKKYLNE